MMTGEWGGAALCAADVERLALGEVEEMRDKIAIAMYPSRDVMRDMRCSPKMEQIGVHCATGLASYLNVERQAQMEHDWVSRRQRKGLVKLGGTDE